MEEFIMNLFKEYGMTVFNSYNCEGYNTIYAKDANENAYYLNVFIDNDNDLLRFKDNYEMLYGEIKNMDKSEYAIDMDKNTSCIVYFCVLDEEYKQFKLENKIGYIEKNVCSIEEDLYYFKKNVLVYSKQQLEYIKKIKSFNDICNELIPKREKFEEFKEDNINNYQYDLIMNMFIKLPFLNFSKYFTTNKSLESLDKYTSNKLLANNFSEEKQLQCNDIYNDLNKLDNDEKIEKWLDNFGGIIK